MKTSMCKRGISRVLLAFLLVSSTVSNAAEPSDSGGVGDPATVTFAEATGVYGAVSVTKAGETVTNDANLAYDVGSESFSINASDLDQGGVATFEVDRLVDLNVTGPTSLVSVDTGTTASVQWLVTSETNDVAGVEFVIVPAASASAQAGNGACGAATPSRMGLNGTSITKVCVDGNNNGVCDVAETNLGAGVGSYTLAAGTTSPGTTVSIVAEISVSGQGGDYDTFVLGAAMIDGAGNQFTDDAGSADVAGTVQNVFGDASGASEVVFGTPAATANPDAALDGQHSAFGHLEAKAPELTISKNSNTVIYDPVNGLYAEATPSVADGANYPSFGTPIANLNPKRIPGTIVEYVIDVQNGSTACSTTADAVSVSDALPNGLAFGLANTDLDCSGNPSVTGVSTTPGGSCSVPNSDWANMLVVACNGTSSNTDNPKTAVAATGLTGGQALGSCAAGEIATITYWTSLE